MLSLRDDPFQSSYNVRKAVGQGRSPIDFQQVSLKILQHSRLVRCESIDMRGRPRYAVSWGRRLGRDEAE